MMTSKGTLCLAVLTALHAACGGDEVDSNARARQAYQGLDLSIDKAIDLGLKGYNEATSANIPEQSAPGNVRGTMTVTGHVDQGSSANKTMNLSIALAGYSDDGKITYDTAAADASADLPLLGMGLKNLPDGTVDGSLAGTFQMTGDLEAEVVLSLSFAGSLTHGEAGAGQIMRLPGTTHITGTAQSASGVYQVDVTR